MRIEALFISGALATGYAIAGLFFLRFWARSRDRLFAMFATTFFLLALQRTGLVVANARDMDTTWLYLLRLLAFLLIIFAIVDKNRRRT